MAHLLQRPLSPILEAEPELEDLGLALAQRVENVVDLLLQELVRGGVCGRQCVPVLDEVAEMAVFLFPDWGLEGDRLLGDLQDLPSPSRG